MFVLISEDFKADSMTVYFSDKSYEITVSCLVVEEHRLPIKIICILESIQRAEEHDIATNQRIVILKCIHTNTISDTAIKRKIENESAENIILL